MEPTSLSKFSGAQNLLTQVWPETPRIREKYHNLARPSVIARASIVHYIEGYARK